MTQRNSEGVACIILAAGMSTRFGSPKQLAEIGGRKLIQLAIEAANGSDAEQVFIVVGANSSKVVEEIELGRAQLLLNKDFKGGISTSIRVGVENLPRDCSGAVIMVADQPKLTSAHINLLITKFLEDQQQNKKTKVVALSYQGRARNPVLVPRMLFDKLLQLEGDSGARELVRNSPDLELIDIEDPTVFLDVDTKESISGLV